MRRAVPLLILTGLLASALLAGCAGFVPDSPQPPRLHDLGPETMQTPEAPPLRVDRIRSPTWLETDRIHYRRLDGDSTQLKS